MFRGENLGALILGEKEGDAEFSVDDLRLLGLFAVQAGVFLDNLNLHGEVVRERSTLSAIQASMADGLVVADAGGRVLYCHQSATALLDVSTEDALGRPIEDIICQRGEDFESLEESPEAALLCAIGNPRELPTTFEVTMVRPQRRELLMTVFPIPVEPGETMTGVLIRDVTAERDLTRSRDSFVSIASHELRTPMASLIGFIELLLQREVPDVKRRQWLGHVHRESLRLANMVDDLLNVSRIQSGKLTTNTENVHLYEVAARALAQVRPITEKHEFVVDIPQAIPDLWADRDKVGEILINLLDNAIKYSPRGGTITISAHDEPDGERVVISVADQGMGIGPENQERLFTTFHRIPRPESAGIRGTGLGLYIVKTLVDLMQGDLWLESELDKGTTFFFALPTLPGDANLGR